MKKKRYFKITLNNFYEGNWEYVYTDSDGMILLYNPNCLGHNGNGDVEDYQLGHCWWFCPDECEEVFEESHNLQECESCENVSIKASHYLLNNKVVDIYTGYKGIVTAYAIWNTGYEQVLVESMDTTGRPISDWLDVRRIKEEE